MKFRIIFNYLALIMLFSSFITKAQSNEGMWTSYVDPFIGTGAIEESALSGNTYPGATVPFGMIQLSPDTRDQPDWGTASGYDFNDSKIFGFSHTHLSGTGVAELFDFLVMPFTGDSSVNINSKFENGEISSSFDHSDENAFPGYYQVYLKDYKVNSELTATSHSGFHRYTFSEEDNPKVLIDLNHSMKKSDWNSRIISSQIEFVDEYTIKGYRIITGWAPLRKIYFYAKFSRPIISIEGSDGENLYEDQNVINGTNVKAVFTFKKGKEPLLLKLGISQVSKGNAKMNLETEIKDWNFNEVVENSNKIWEESLSKIKIKGTEKQKKIFYTALYHSFIQPNNIADVNGEYLAPDFTVKKMKSKKYYSTLSLWDTYRAIHPLYSLIQREVTADVVNSMISYSEDFGYLPIWQLWGLENYCMIGNHAIPVIVDAYMSTIEGIDVEKAYNSIKKSSLINHPGSPFNIWEKYHYMPETVQSQSVSLTLEMSYDDWCVAQMAKSLGKSLDYEYFLKRSQFYKNLFDSKSGFFRAKDEHGNWIAPFDPLNYGANGGNPYTEGNAWQYLWYVPHDIEGLIELLGGNKEFTNKLDTFFTLYDSPSVINDNASGLIGQYAHGNEPSHHVAYLYNYAKQPWKTQYYVSKILNDMYNTNSSGYAGNEDCGELSAWYVLSSMGFYPVNPDGKQFSIGSPILKESIISLDNGNTLKIKAENVSSKNIYIQELKINGVSYDKSYISKDIILNGGEFVFVMGDKPNSKWGN